MTAFTYRLFRLCDRPVVSVVANRIPVILDPEWSQRVWNHSPDGFEWGYAGSGPAQLALAIMLDYFRHTAAPSFPKELIETFAQNNYQAFKRHFIATCPKAGRDITSEEISAWLGHESGKRVTFDHKPQ